MSQFQICQPSDEGLSLKLESVDRVRLPFVSLKTFEAIANQEDTNDTFHRVDITGLISEAFFDQLTPEYISHLRDLMFQQ